jgi:glycosyltransferase involved in cell wall biosynthesis
MSGGSPKKSDHAPGATTPIAEPYLLVTGIACFIDEKGKRWTDALWHKDLVEHLAYLKNFTLAAPLRATPLPANVECLSDDRRFAHINYVDLPSSDSLVAGVLDWPRAFLRLWGAGGRARIIHAGVAGWPIPTGWAASLVAKLRRRTLLINVESDFWRVSRSAPTARRVQSWIWERINRWCVRTATLPLFTHDEYARQMLPDARRRHIFHASWIDAANVLDQQTAEQVWDSKQSVEPLNLLFAGRLVAEKGLPELLEAIASEDLPVVLDVIGSGGLEEAVKQASQQDSRIRLLPPVAYGEQFFQLLRQYHAVIVPTRTGEQPRVAYDAYSQAVPVLATRTPGNASCIIDGETGYLAPPRSAAPLRDLIDRALSDRQALREMGMQALLQARSYTHQEMHRRRWELLDHFLHGDLEFTA